VDPGVPGALVSAHDQRRCGGPGRTHGDRVAAPAQREQDFCHGPLRIRSLGVERDIFVPHPGTIYVLGSRDSEEFTNALEAVCKG
jgi:hypothetical protein